jgi:hypothetical protein
MILKKQIFSLVVLVLLGFSNQGFATDKPNILVIWGDDIGLWNLSRDNMRMMGYQTPNIDRFLNRSDFGGIKKEVLIDGNGSAVSKISADLF